MSWGPEGRQNYRQANLPSDVEIEYVEVDERQPRPGEFFTHFAPGESLGEYGIWEAAPWYPEGLGNSPETTAFIVRPVEEEA